jgi:hypothetical protein
MQHWPVVYSREFQSPTSCISEGPISAQAGSKERGSTTSTGRFWLATPFSKECDSAPNSTSGMRRRFTIGQNTEKGGWGRKQPGVMPPCAGKSVSDSDDQPSWISLPAMMKMRISTPHYLDQMKGKASPFGFVLHPRTRDKLKLTLLSRFSKNRTGWAHSLCINTDDGRTFRNI